MVSLEQSKELSTLFDFITGERSLTVDTDAFFLIERVFDEGFNDVVYLCLVNLSFIVFISNIYSDLSKQLLYPTHNQSRHGLCFCKVPCSQ
jgi:hypothetical protein